MIKAKNFYLLVNALIIGGVLALCTHIILPQTDVYILCIFKQITGLPCPACGLVHAMDAMVHFDIFQAIKYNTLSPIVFLVAIAIIPWQIYDLFKRKATMYHTFVGVNEVLKERSYFIAVISMIGVSWAVNISRHFNLI